MLTIFSVPKPFEGHVGTIQTNALQSWTLLQPPCEIILFGDEPGTAEAAERFGVRHVADVSHNEHGTPRLDSIFAKADELASSSLLCYVNADVMLTGDLPEAVSQINFDRFLLVGRRWDTDIGEPWDFADGWEEKLRDHAVKTGVLHGTAGHDFFVFPRGMWRKMPAFVVGRPGWDNWMIYDALTRKIPVIDGTEAVTVVHQQHGYSHHPQGERGVWEGEEARANIELAGGYRKALFGIPDATWMLPGPGKGPVRNWRHLRRAIHTWPVLHWWARPLMPVGPALVWAKNTLNRLTGK